jgi:hypothetical protein
MPAVKFKPAFGNQTRAFSVANMMNMKSRTKWIVALFLTVSVLVGTRPIGAFAQTAASDQATAVFSGGCFWGVDAVFKHVKGVDKVVSGYAGGAANTAQYGTVSTGTTGHAESVQVTYDPTKVSYDDLLKVFISSTHSPHRSLPRWFRSRASIRPKTTIRTTWNCTRIHPTSSTTTCRNWKSFRRTYPGSTSSRSQNRSAGGAAKFDLAHLVGA